MIAALVVTSALMTFPVAAQQERGADSFTVNAYLCETADYAMDFAAAIANDSEEEYAKDVVGRIAQREVCGRYMGVAAIEEQKVVVSGGIMYRLTALRFREDHKLAWVAERVFAVEQHSSEWHL
jgi:hypothetical protein